MSFYPHSCLFIGNTLTVDIAGPYIQVFKTTTGHLLNSTALIDEEEQKKSLIKSGHVRCAAVDREFKYLITSGEDKMLKVWELDGLNLLSERELPKKPTSMQFTADAQTILVSDKFGDIFSYPFIYVPLTVKQQRDALSSHENPSGGQLILGHASPLNAFLLTKDEKYIVTADRDEHIRVSWYPKGYNIEMYCLGHLKFVSAVHIPKSDPTSLISGGGDPVLKIWDWMTGVLKHEVAVLDAVEPFMAVRALKRKRGSGDLDDGEDISEGARIKRKKGHRKGKGKEKAKEKDKEADGDDGDGDADEDKEEAPRPEKVLVIHKIDTLLSDSGPHVIFSAVGATALFTFPYSENVSSTALQHFDFGRPVLDFMVGDDGVIVVSLDGQWTSDEPDVSGNNLMVRTVKFTDELVETFDTHKPLIESLNSNALLPASAEDLKKLDLYDELTSMPKYTADPENITAEGPESMLIGDQVQSSTATKELSKKELGRMKSKQAVLAAKAKQPEDRVGNDASGANDDVDIEEPDTKRARSTADDEMEG